MRRRCGRARLCLMIAGLGHEYETVLAISPLQKLLTYARAEVVLTALPNWAWRAVEDWLVPLAEGLGYKVGARAPALRGWGSAAGSRAWECKEGVRGCWTEA